ncbi:sodium:calcium antiporter [Halorussus pelagicus]|uniref:sodium:calcium antiporter n=1 Tax=Halorussus pelagicus TaxID=2505977 RepID=UPI000FFB81CD|nr:sodium:calcium antiporter [Halorussus pelagicus]
MLGRLRHPLSAVGATTALTLPWLYIWATGSTPALTHLQTVAISGIAVLGASFMLAWGAETAEKDVPRAFALAVLAVLAVAPEYAVDALYAWTAGANVGTERGMEAANLAVANMTGANRILIGLGWSGIALFTVYRTLSSEDPAVVKESGFLKSKVQIDRDLATEIAFLLAATAYAFFVPFGAGIGMVDTLFLVGLYAIYIGIIIRGEVDEHDEQVGVPAYFQSFSKLPRVASVLLLFGYSGGMIYTAVHPFAHGLEELGLALGIPPFFMIQWIAPLASESPELIVVAYLVNKARSTAGFNALISSKLNQWTLLIGTLAVVYSIASGAVGSLPFDEKQQAEIWITAAQSFFALGILANFEISVREAIVLLVLFLSQVVAEFAVIRILAEPQAGEWSMLILYAYTAVYLVLGAALFVLRRGELRGIFDRTAANARNALPGGSDPVEHAD